MLAALALIVDTTSLAAEQSGSAAVNGTSTGNLNNSGFYVAEGDAIYYNSFSREGGLYRVNEDGSGKTKIADGFYAYMNLVGDELYYSDGWKLTKMKLDGSAKQVLAPSAFHVNVAGDYVYYSNIGPQDGLLYRIKTDGTGTAQLLSSDHISQLVVSGSRIYYTSYYNKLFEMSTDGKSKTKLLTGKTINELNVAGDWLYFNYDQHLYKMKTDGSKLTLLSADDARSINVSGDWIYYSNYGDNKKLTRIRTDGTDREALSQAKSMYIHVIGSHVFYHDMSKMAKLDVTP